VAQIGGTFSARNVPPQSAPEAWPEGWHKVIIFNSEIVAALDNANNKMLRLHYRGIEGPMTGKETNENINLWNQNQQASEIAQRTLSSVCHVTGVYDVQDSAQLHNIPMQIRIAHTKSGETVYGNVKAHKDIHGNDPGKTGAGQQAPAPAPVQQAPQQYAQPAAAAPQNGQFAVSAPMPMPGAPAGAPAPAGWPAGPPAATAPAPQYQQPAQQYAQPAQQAPQTFQQGPMPGAPPWGPR
jgi:hypothetical protein